MSDPYARTTTPYFCRWCMKRSPFPLEHPTLGRVCQHCLRPMGRWVKPRASSPPPRQFAGPVDSDRVVMCDASHAHGRAWAWLAAIAQPDDVLVSELAACSGSAEAERLALEAAMREVRRRGWERVCFWTDAKPLVQRIYRHQLTRPLPAGWRVEFVARHRVHPAHVHARRELRAWIG